MLQRILYIDLTDRKHEVADRPNLFDELLGGDSVAIKLLGEECPKGVHPLAPESPVIFTIGPLTSLFPCCSKVVSMFKSPLTGELGESHAGGRLGLAMRFADYGAIVIRGRSDSPVYISIHDDDVKIKDAKAIWGLTTYAAGRVLREVEPGKGRRSIIKIGPAGEREINFANVNVDTYRHFGRLGLGAVFGSKMLKAMVISGSKSFPIHKLDEYTSIYKTVYREIMRTDLMKKYHDLGTTENVLPLNALGALPTRNLSATTFEKAEDISGERLAEQYLTRKMACSHCPLGCIHIATLRVPFAEGHEYESIYVSYDYEPLYALGSMLGIGHPPAILKLIERIEKHGLDAMSTGVTLAWATEAFKRGMVSEEETRVALDWGDVDSYIRTVDDIILLPNEFYRVLSRGVEAASREYGGRSFALALGGNEMAGYHCGPATIMGQLVGCRHSHLDNAGYSLDQRAMIKPVAQDKMVDALIKEEQWRCVTNALVICLFARGIYTEGVVVKALGSLGIERAVDDLEQLGRKIFKAKYAFKVREGFRFDRLRIPERLLETPSASGKLDASSMKAMLDLYAERVDALLRS